MSGQDIIDAVISSVSGRRRLGPTVLFCVDCVSFLPRLYSQRT